MKRTSFELRRSETKKYMYIYMYIYSIKRCLEKRNIQLHFVSNYWIFYFEKAICPREYRVWTRSFLHSFENSKKTHTKKKECDQLVYAELLLYGGSSVFFFILRPSSLFSVIFLRNNFLTSFISMHFFLLHLQFLQDFFFARLLHFLLIAMNGHFF